MDSSDLDRHNVTKTRLQEKTEKRRAEDDLRQQEQVKRQKKMFAPRKLIGPRDVIVNFSKIKLEGDVGCSSFVKKEPLELDCLAPTEVANASFADSNLTEIKKEEDSKLVVKAEEILEEYVPADKFGEHYEEIEHLGNVADVEHKVIIKQIKKQDCVLDESALEIEDETSFQNHIKQLKVFIKQKGQEIKSLLEVIKGMQLQLHASDNILFDLDVENEQFVLIDVNINKNKVIQGSTSENARVVANLTSDLMEKHAKIRILTMKMLKLQDRMFGTANYDLEASKNYKTSGDFVQESFNLVLPFLYPDLQLNDLLRCRIVCRSWQSATDTFLNDQSSTMSFDKKTQLEEIRALTYGRKPVWNESPLKKLAKVYRFSNFEELKPYKNEQHCTIVGNTICLDNLVPTKKFHMSTLTKCLETFDGHIMTLVIRQSIDFPDFRIGLLMNYVKICLGKLQNIQRFKLVFCIDKDEMESKMLFNALEDMRNATLSKKWFPGTFPQLTKLESLEFNVEVSGEWNGNVDFLQNFCKCLVQPYSNQLKKLCLCTPGIDTSDCLVFPNLVHFSFHKVN